MIVIIMVGVCKIGEEGDGLPKNLLLAMLGTLWILMGTQLLSYVHVHI